MIKTFRDSETEKVFKRERSRRLTPSIQTRAYRKLMAIHISETVGDLRAPPGNHLECLAGNRAGQYSIRINDQWRLCFRWHLGDAYDVEIVDYH